MHFIRPCVVFERWVSLEDAAIDSCSLTCASDGTELSHTVMSMATGQWSDANDFAVTPEKRGPGASVALVSVR